MKHIFLSIALLVSISAGAQYTVNVGFTPSDSAAYSAGYVMGGIQTLSFSPLLNNRGGTLENVAAVDSANKKPAIDLYYFSQLPTGTYTNRTAAVFTYADMQHLICVVHILTTDWTTIGRWAYCSLARSGFAVQATGATNKLYCIPVSVGSYTPSSKYDITITSGLHIDR